MAAETNIDIDKVRGSGKHGVILKEDVMSLMGSNQLHQKEKLNMDLKKELK